jgi:ornithine carbamoyltransferase
MAKRDLVSIYDISREEMARIVNDAIAMKKNPKAHESAMKNKTLVMFFEKPSTRTRLSFETGMTKMGGHAIYFGKDSQLAAGNEDLMDTANVVSRYADIIMARVFKHETVENLAKFASVPVINALCDIDHPCQTLADVMTIKEKKGWGPQAKVAWVGDGDNVCNPLMVACAMLGMPFAVATPKGYEPNAKYIEVAKKCAGKNANNNSLTFTNDPKAAVKDADVVVTDTWVSMGQEDEKARRLKDFAGYTVDAAMMKLAKPDAIFMHCLPAHKGYEVTKDVIEGPQSVVYDEAENRLWAQNALMVWMLSESV